MKLTIFNGSPKPGKSNTEILLKNFIEGFLSQGKHEIEVVKLNQIDLEKAVDLFNKSEAVLLAFPLYSYSMPGGVKLFIEKLEPFCGKCYGKKIGFLVQYGFQEAIHARPLEKYLVRISRILDCDYMGTIIKGGCDGLSKGPENRFKKILTGSYKIGDTLGRTGTFDHEELEAYSKPENQKQTPKWLMNIIMRLLNKFYWGPMLKKNNVSIEESYAQPYA